jgi:hypothetical protein
MRDKLGFVKLPVRLVVLFFFGNSTLPVAFNEALIRRTATFIGNCIQTAVAGAIGWALGGLIPPYSGQST